MVPTTTSTSTGYRKKDDINLAIKRLENELTRQPENGFLFKELADFYRNNDQFAKARDSYLKAKSLGYNALDLDRSLGITYERLDQDLLAERSFQKLFSKILRTHTP